MVENVDQAQFDKVAGSFGQFHGEFAPLFGPKEAQVRSEQYLRGLLVQQTDRRNAENVAESITGASPRSLQRFISESPWDSEAVIERLQGYLEPRLSMPDGVFVFDETGFPKQGNTRVGAARQYCSAAIRKLPSPSPWRKGRRVSTARTSARTPGRRRRLASVS